MACPTNRTVVVFGATGSQGGSVVRALAKSPNFKIRGVTRNKTSAKAQELAKLGVEVIEANVDDKASLKAAMTGAHGVFLVTNYWEFNDIEREIQQGRNAIEAAKECKIKHFVYSGLEDVKALCGFECPHFDAKGRVEVILKDSGLPYTIIRLAFYMQNFLTAFPPQKLPDGSFVVGVPMGEVAMDMVSVDDIGAYVKTIFSNPNDNCGKTIGIGGDRLTVDQMAGVFASVLGVKVANAKMSVKDFKALGFPGAEDLGNMFEFYQTGKIDRDVQRSRKVCPTLSNFRTWVEKNKDALLKAMNPS